MSKINVRSPYFINLNEQYLTFAKLELYVYTGTQTTDRGSIKFTVNSTAINENITFEISELVRDYIEQTFDGSYSSSSSVWVDYQITKTLQNTPQPVEAFVQLTAFDGYGYFEEGTNPQNDSITLQSNDFIYTNDLSSITIPVHVTDNTTVTYFKDGDIVFSKILLSSTSSTDQIQYVSNSSLSYEAFYNRVITDGGIIEALGCVKEIANDYQDDLDADTIHIEQNGSVEVIEVEEIGECKYNPYKITFVNKYGALQDIWFFKRANLSMQTTEESYRANIVSSGTYSIHSRQKTVFDKKGVERLQLNTGFYPESYNEIFRQLSLSEELWITYENYVLPITLLSSELTYKTSLNDKLINYTMDVEFAFNKINNIR